MKFNKHAILFLILTYFAAGNPPQNKYFAQSGSKPKPKPAIMDQDQRENEKAKVLRVKVRYKYAALYDKTGKHILKKSLAEKALFNRDGTMKELTRFNGQGITEFKYVLKYDSKGNLLTAETLSPDGDVATKRISKYDRSGNEIERLVIDNRHPGTKKTEYIYDLENNLIGTKNYSTSNEVVSSIISNYENGMLKSSITKNAKNEIAEEVIYQYDQSGRLQKEDRKKKGQVYSQSYTYDKNGNMIESVNPQYKRYYSYNEKNQLTEDRLFQSGGTRQFRVRFTYYPNGLQKEEIRYDNDERAGLYGETRYEYYK